MQKFFNTTGPCNPDDHYMLPPKDRLIGADLDRYLENHLYWVLHAPRQTGKTTFLRSWMKEINESGKGIACYVSVERCQGMESVEEAMPNLCEAITESAKNNELPIPVLASSQPLSMLVNIMHNWAEICAPKPLIVLFDEVDVLSGPAMVSFLRQLRDGFAGRGIGKFPTSMALVGMCDPRDYLAESKDGKSDSSGSPFNIVEDSISLSNFTKEDIKNLTAQHTECTGQVFTSEALDRLWYWSNGQPWITNALCQTCVWYIVKQETKRPVEAPHIEEAKEKLILSRATHIDSLAERLREARVKRVVEPIITGETVITIGRNDADRQLCMDLGLVEWDGTFKIANRIYQEIIARFLNQNYHDNLPIPEWQWQNHDGTLAIELLLEEFQKFWRRHSETWEEKADYTEAFPHLLLMAFFQRIINGGGTVHREYAAGRGRMDLAVEYAKLTHVVEVKLVHPQDGRKTTLEEGLEQTARYADTVEADTCHLFIFDRRPVWKEKPWEERLARETYTCSHRTIEVLWC